MKAFRTTFLVTRKLLFHAMARRTLSSPSPPRRITRSSLARFAYKAGGETKAESLTPDIEDSVVDIGATVAAASRKRKRTTTATVTAPAKSSSRRAAAAAAAVVKTEEEESSSPAPEKKTKRPPQRKPARKTVDPATGAAGVAPPSDWEAIYDAVAAMRAPGGPAANAAVDTMGCERLADTAASPRDRRLQTLVALMLSSQTKDTTNAVVMRKLQTELPPHKPGAPPGLNLENLLAVEPDTLNQLIWAVGFHNNKTRYLQQAAAILRDEWAGDIPDTIAGLTALPGVGPKMAHLCLSAAWGRTEGIGVDVHVHRLTNLWGWHATRTPEATRAALESWLPRDRWRPINALLVGFGQTVCGPAAARRCGDCDLGLRGLCRAAERKKVLEGRRRREAKVEVKDDGELDVKVKEEEELVEKDVVVNESS